MFTFTGEFFIRALIGFVLGLLVNCLICNSQLNRAGALFKPESQESDQRIGYTHKWLWVRVFSSHAITLVLLLLFTVYFESAHLKMYGAIFSPSNGAVILWFHGGLN